MSKVGVEGGELMVCRVRISDSDAVERKSRANDGWAKSGIIIGTYRGNRVELELGEIGDGLVA